MVVSAAKETGFLVLSALKVAHQMDEEVMTRQNIADSLLMSRNLDTIQPITYLKSIDITEPENFSTSNTIAYISTLYRGMKKKSF